MAKPIAGVGDYPYGVCGFVVDGAHLKDFTKKKMLRIYKQRSDVMFDLIDPTSNTIYQKVLLTGYDTDGNVLNYNESDNELLSKIARNTFFVRGYNDQKNREGFVIRFLLNKIILSTGKTLYDMYTPTCTIPLPDIDNIVINPVHVNDTAISGAITSSSGALDVTDMVVKIELPGGAVYEGTVNPDGTFSISPVVISQTGSAMITITSPHYNDIQTLFPVYADGADSDFVTSINIAHSDFSLQFNGQYAAKVPAIIHGRGSDLVVQLHDPQGDALQFSTVDVDASGNITVNQRKPQPVVVVLIGRTSQSVPFHSSLSWTPNGDGSSSASITKAQHGKSNMSYTVYDGTSACTVQVRVNDTDDIVLTALDGFAGSIVIAGKD